jgi:hypothetical protein
MHTLTHLLEEAANPRRFSNFIDFHNVQRLEFYGWPGPSIPGHSGHIMMQSFDIGYFLAYHCRKLRSFRVTDIVPLLYRTMLPRNLGIQLLHCFLVLKVREITGPGLDAWAREWEIIQDPATVA